MRPCLPGGAVPGATWRNLAQPLVDQGAPPTLKCEAAVADKEFRVWWSGRSSVIRGAAKNMPSIPRKGARLSRNDCKSSYESTDQIRSMR